MESAASRMSELINDLLAFSQLSTKAFAKEPIPLTEVIQNVLTDLDAAVAEKKARIEYKDLPVIKADKVQLRQLFQNLLSNSLKYSNPAKAPVITIESEAVQCNLYGSDNSYYKITVADNGIGFEQEHAERIFRMFQRLHGRSEYPGNGVGLAIAYKVVENHNGTITATGKVDEGATFTILLPQ
jgi:light-regulated signal transduction histidine kinase (bacteriophytochrome)